MTLILALAACAPFGLNDGTPSGHGPPHARPKDWANHTPRVTGVSVSPTVATEATTLTCSATAVDLDGDPLTLSYGWRVDGTDPGVTGPTLDGASFDEGQRVVCQVTASDGVATSRKAVSASVPVFNSPPTATAAVAPSSPGVGDALSCDVHAVELDGADLVTVDVSWLVNGVPVGDLPTLEPGPFVRDDEVWCEATVDDGQASVVAQSATVVVANTAPTLVSATFTPEAPTYLDTVVLDVVAEDADGDPISLEVGWAVNGVRLAETGESLDPSNFARGDELLATVRAWDGLDYGAWSIVGPVVVVDGAPEPPEVRISPPSPVAGDGLLCTIESPPTDPDGDPLTVSVAWLVDGVAYVGATTTILTGDTVPAPDSELGTTWTCVVTTSDGDDDVVVSTSVEVWHPVDLEIDGTTYTLAEGESWWLDVRVVNGGTLVIEGSVVLNAESFVVDPRSAVDGRGRGGAGGDGSDGAGPSGGVAEDLGGGGGGGHGGDGGDGGHDTGEVVSAGGTAYGDRDDLTCYQGSGGGSGFYEPGGNGGAGLKVIAPFIAVAGTIDVDGEDAADSELRAGGGGAGGGVTLWADELIFTGTITANGGAGGDGVYSTNDGGGGGAGGRVKLFYDSTITRGGSTQALGGAGGVGGTAADGEPGSGGTSVTLRTTFAP